MSTEPLLGVAPHDAPWLLGVAGAPLLVAAAIIPPRWRTPALRIAPWSGLPALMLALTGRADVTVEVPWLLLGVRLGLDETGQVFLLFTSLLWVISGLFAQSYLARDVRRHRFFAFYLVTMSGNLGLTVAQDVVSFYLFFSLMTFAAYGLIVHEGGAAARRAGRVYMSMAIGGEVLLFMAFMLAVEAAGTHDLGELRGELGSARARDWTVGLLLCGFGVKAGALVLHVWLPLAHPIAPTPASAVLSGAMIKAGLLGWLRFLPLGVIPLPEWGALCVVAGMAAAFYGVLVGLTQENPKAVLAYSSVSQMGYMTVALGLGLMSPSLWPAAWVTTLVYAAHHALAKAALFLGAGVATASRDRARLAWTLLGLLVPALALAGAPLTSGALAKPLLKNLATAEALPWTTGLEPLLSIAAFGTSLLLGRFLWLLWSQRERPVHAKSTSGLGWTWSLALLSVASAPWLILGPHAAPAFTCLLTWEEVWSGLWPVLGGAAAALSAGALLSRARNSWYPRIPEGDVLAIAVWLGDRLRDTYRASRRESTRLGSRALSFVRSRP